MYVYFLIYLYNNSYFNFLGLLEDRPGVQIRGGRGVGDLGLPIYSLNDVEEDDEFPGKRFDNSNLIYTYTNRFA